MSKLVRKFEKEKYNLAKKYIEEKKISKGLRYLTEDIFILLGKGLTKKEVLEIINDELKVNIKEQSFYTFCNRVLSKLESYSAKDNQLNYRLTPEREKDVSSSIPAPVSISQKPKKETKNETTEVKEKKKVNPAEILNSDIFATDSEYKNLL